MANTVAYGFYSIQDLFSRRVSEVGVERIFDAVQETLDEYNRIVNAMLATLVEPTTVAQEQYELPGSGTLQPLDEYGNPLPTMPGASYKVGYPIQGGGDAWGDNRITRAMMTVAEANQNTLEALRKDRDWLLRHMLAALLDNTAWTYNDKLGPNGAKGLGDITVQPLANGDAVTYLKRGGSVATDSHYLFQKGDISDSLNPFPTIRQELIEHPSVQPPFVAQVASNLVEDIAGLTEFVEVDDPDIRYGADSDTLSAMRPDILGAGVEILGKTKSSNIWIVEMPNLPSSYMLAYSLATDPVLRMRQYPAPELQGLFQETASRDGNTVENRVIRYAGFGAANRVGAVAFFVGTSETSAYATPSAYDAPLAI